MKILLIGKRKTLIDWSFCTDILTWLTFLFSGGELTFGGGDSVQWFWKGTTKRLLIIQTISGIIYKLNQHQNKQCWSETFLR